MSDDYYSDDDDEYLYVDYGPVAEADDLAEHTLASPVLLNFDPSFQLNDDVSDWQYCSDDYFDELSEPVAKKRTLCKEEQGGTADPNSNAKRKRSDSGPSRSKRRKLAGDPSDHSESDTARPARDSPKLVVQVVRWKQEVGEQSAPLDIDRVGEKVSLLPDWRERLGIPKRRQSNKEQPSTRGTQPNRCRRNGETLPDAVDDTGQAPSK